MLFNGKAIECSLDADGIVHVIFDIKDSGANVIGELMTSEFPEAIKAVESCKDKKGLIFRSNKSHFIFGADITEFTAHFKKDEGEIKDWISQMNFILNRFEDIGVPSVALINGFALGGGFEVCLSADYRIITKSAKVGLPETKLGIMPGWGGTVRLPRLCGTDHAIEWIASGKQWSADEAFEIGAVDGVVEDDKLLEAGTRFIKRCISLEIDWRARNTEKKSPIRLNKIEATMCFETSKGFVASLAGKNYPAPLKVVKTIEASSKLTREEALDLEALSFASLAKTKAAESLIQVFLGDQYLKKISKKMVKGSDKISKASVIGAGIMGGGIAYQSASRGVPILMKDINDKALELGMNEASTLLTKQIERGKIDTKKMAATLSAINPTLSYGDMGSVDIIVEAVVENEKIKMSVIKELEDHVSENTVIASNTSTISITKLAKDLKRPENFCGMHFFNPVHKMPLVEVIRGEKTSDATIAKTVQYAMQMGKTPIVVNDCPGFLVNRVLFPYFNGFNKLVEDGVDFKRIDKVMESFGWPMGPAYLSDVIGMDTGDHAASIMAECFPDRMKLGNQSIIQALHKKNRLGQKNSLGFYSYAPDRRGRIQKNIDESVDSIIAEIVKRKVDITDEQIVERMMIPMIFECARCLEENIVASAVEVDMGLLLGLGFPPFRAGAMKYADTIGLKNLMKASEKYIELGEMYKAPKGFVEKANSNQTYYGEQA